MNRRSFLRDVSMLALIGGVPSRVLANVRNDPLKAQIFVPGYEMAQVSVNGRSVVSHPDMARALGSRSSVNGAARMLTRVSLAGDVMQAVFPVNAHDVKISPDGKTGIICGFEAPGHAAFDPESLDMIALAPSLDVGWRGGGHAAFSPDGHVLLTERAPRTALDGDSPVAKYGRVSIRDPRSLSIVDSYSSFGIDPHDLCFLDDGRYLAVANYGSLPQDGQSSLGVPRHVVEACVAVIDAASGRLLEKYSGAMANAEIRHLVSTGGRSVAAIQALLGDDMALADVQEKESIAYPVDQTSEPGIAYLPASPLLMRSGNSPVAMGASSSFASRMRHGLSITFDATQGQVIATFPSSHTVMVFSADDGRVLQVIDTLKQGLRYPCGIALLPGGRHYIVTGYWENLHVYELGTHHLLREYSIYPTFFGHSHIALG